jgi:hypothetical protein
MKLPEAIEERLAALSMYGANGAPVLARADVRELIAEALDAERKLAWNNFLIAARDTSGPAAIAYHECSEFCFERIGRERRG